MIRRTLYVHEVIQRLKFNSEKLAKAYFALLGSEKNNHESKSRSMYPKIESAVSCSKSLHSIGKLHENSSTILNPAYKQTDKQTNKQTNKPTQIHNLFGGGNN